MPFHKELWEEKSGALMDFHKYHALGNDYIVIDPRKTDIDLCPENIRLICHRNFGVGSDGILCGPIIDKGKIGLNIYNPDGSKAEKSGNGIRIFSRYLMDTGYVSESEFTLHTLGGKVNVSIADRKAGLIKVDMGTVTFQSEEIPISGGAREVINEDIKVAGASYSVTCLSIGNPHCVIPLEKISEHLAKEIGPEVENHPMFPNRINMQLLELIDRENIRIEIWERGAGYTLASGSSSCAAASAARRLGLVGDKIDVHMPGGTLQIEVDESEHVHMTGPVTNVAEGDFSNEMWQAIREKQL